MLRIPPDLFKQIDNTMPLFCVDVIIEHQGQVLFVHRKEHPAKDHWWLIGGRVLKGETLQQAAKRKADEEAGLSIEIVKQLGTYEMTFQHSSFEDVETGRHTINVVFLAKLSNENQTVELDNTSKDFKWTDEFTNLHPYLQRALSDSNLHPSHFGTTFHETDYDIDDKKLSDELYTKIEHNIPVHSVNLIVHYDQKILLVKRTNEPEMGKWWVPGVRLLKQETMEQAVQRKANELGITVSSISQGKTHEYIEDFHHISTAFIVEAQHATNSFDHRWVSEIGESLHPYVQKVINDSEVFTRDSQSLKRENELETSMIPETTRRETCRVCYSPNLTELFSLGEQFVNDFPKDTKGEGIKAPLDMIFCENCTLVQLRHTAPQELLYKGFYWYKSGVTDTMKAALRDITKSAERFNLKSNDIVLDIGSNDGTMLRTYQVPGLITVGVEPAKNLAEEGRQGITHFINDFWNIQSYNKTIGKKAKIVTAIGMFYDMEDPNQFVKDAADALTDDGVFIAQLMCSKNMLDKNDVGNICHEHLEYYSFKSLEVLFNKNGLDIFDVEINEVNGQSYRLFARKIGTTAPIPLGSEERVRKVKEEEKALLTKQPYLDFFERIEKQKSDCVTFINKELARGKKIWVFGASTKGNVILQYYNLDKNKIQAASERSPWKFGRYTVGTHIPIVAEQEAREANPDYFLVLPYAFFDEMYDRETEWLQNGGKFIVPLPEFRVVGLENNQRKEWKAYELLASDTLLDETKSITTESNVTSEPAKISNGGQKKALILGITGQDGSYLAEILLEKGYDVHGFIRRSATGNKDNIQHLLDKITLHKGDLADPTSIYRVINEVRPHEIYNEADQDHVSWSWGSVGYSMDITGAAVGRILETIKQIDPTIKYFQPVSSNIFGQSAENPQTEESPFRPQSPYACGKVLAYVLARYYRDVFGLFVSTGIYYNHESPRRTDEYVTRKITKAAARIKLGLQKKLSLGNLDAKIDWGYAKEYMEAAWNIMQLDNPDDFILCTGEVHSLREFVNEAFSYVGLNPDDYIEFDPRFARPGNTSVLIGDTSKAQEAFGFNPRIRFKQIIKLMIDHDLKEAEKELRLTGESDVNRTH
ncbi:MAG: hypothetical protein CMH61_02875 [Nanoarchaeota archaeon]|nr:hypothetical protein [Nanoarchaeota archaeon]|tara:strand:- start:4623 stop:7931 length:3309 start_codon:yes stop_codon:yes gene_type:complete